MPEPIKEVQVVMGHATLDSIIMASVKVTYRDSRVFVVPEQAFLYMVQELRKVLK